LPLYYLIFKIPSDHNKTPQFVDIHRYSCSNLTPDNILDHLFDKKQQEEYSYFFIATTCIQFLFFYISPA